ncbi:23S rRNA (uracil(747)-C(5))-methyltransferase RlmC [Photobacterium angustum]|uniref:23S rRNA (uracil(747)-C(5))-methyltransferase RlmC n=1 Tax=Photobacterium angustum TaxID=661 RepID=A0A855SH60_PHOAN|nr:23S rRNA (uracil(747)-C(5))-methyltransferase RlmC [Photobacterium angustum]KJF82442.1 23S rRNA methyltransferase [Photobacterium damselae subsp. damselae]KJG34395.1 23S rRNA methyltransferase [Photobacterium angustum]KJG41821.1 23S rRNA methyltransferase [Photobacterium angustum]KJG46426.1 23S rRNA methyltransferase [Photobacterium angustum]KJG50567.1 23S rRNA methyltransferase [Photobacterium angustum]
MQCPFSLQGVCQSCPLASLSYPQQIKQKDDVLRGLFSEYHPQQWLAPVESAISGYRNKAKMVVLGAAHEPCLGIQKQTEDLSTSGSKPIGLCTCPLYPADMQALLIYIERWIRCAGIPPYNVKKKKGELKFVLLTRSNSRGEFMLRFVLRSHDAIARIVNNLPELMAAFPSVKVVSVNIQPVHMARLEGEEEIFLTSDHYLLEQFNHVPLVVRPKSFFQTNPKVAESLYATAKRWVSEIKPASMWDLFCGVGGFALHCAEEVEHVTGIEIEPEAIESAKHSAETMGVTNLRFAALDSTSFSQSNESAPELVLVNPPRRGIGEQLCQQLNDFAPKHIIYSSCNPYTLEQDLARLTGYKVIKLQWFDMFPHTEHVEVMVLLEHSNV